MWPQPLIARAASGTGSRSSLCVLTLTGTAAPHGVELRLICRRCGTHDTLDVARVLDPSMPSCARKYNNGVCRSERC